MMSNFVEMLYRQLLVLSLCPCAKYPQFQTALDQLHDSAPQYAGALLSVFPEARQIVQQQIENMLNGQATPEEAAAEMASQINSSIEEYNLVNE